MAKRGRPKRDVWDEMRTRAWFNAVSIKSGKKTAYKLERLFSKLPMQKRINFDPPCAWNKYQSGEVSPSESLVDKVEMKFPSTAVWFRHPFWQVLKNHPIDLDRAKNIFESFDDRYKPIIFNLEFGQRFKVMRPVDDELIAKLEKIVTLDSLTILLTYYSQLQNPLMYPQVINRLSDGISSLWLRISEIPELQGVRERIHKSLLLEKFILI